MKVFFFNKLEHFNHTLLRQSPRGGDITFRFRQRSFTVLTQYQAEIVRHTASRRSLFATDARYVVWSLCRQLSMSVPNDDY